MKHVVMTHDGTVSTKFLGMCGKAGARVSFFDHYGWYQGSFEPIEGNRSGEIHVRQAALASSPEGLSVARTLVAASIQNSMANLRYHLYRGNERLSVAVGSMGKQMDGLPHAPDRQAIMGMEGMARRTYLEAWPIVDERLRFGPRVRRPSNNPVNCLISFLNSLTYSMVRHEIAKTHLAETVSFLHAPSSARSSLSLDLAEPFKPLLTDPIIWSAVRKTGLSEAWFEEPMPGVCLLTQNGRKHFVDAFARLADGEDGVRHKAKTAAISLERKVLGIGEFEVSRRRV